MPREIKPLDKPLSLEEIAEKSFKSGLSGMSAMIV
jgi:hypothetical protein